MALGGICGSLFGGYGLNSIQMGHIFLVFLPSIQLFSFGFVIEIPISSPQLPEISTSNDTDTHNVSLPDESRLSFGSPISPKSPKASTLMRKRSHKSSKKEISDISRILILEEDESLPLQWFQSLKMAGYSLFKAFRLQIISRLSHVTLSILTLIDIVLVYRVNVSFGILDEIMVFFGSALSDAIHQFKYVLYFSSLTFSSG
ncbi:biopterin transport-related protein BT1 [Tanacetum coccineum]